MNIVHIKYAVAVAQYGSLNKASENLMVAQPNLSRCIRDLESDLGITIFDRTTRGMVLTRDGEQFLSYAKKLCMLIDDIENIFKGDTVTQRFSACVPRASYIADAFSRLSKFLTNEPAEIYYEETNSKATIQKVLSTEYKLGIIRYSDNQAPYFQDMLDEKGLCCEVLAEFTYSILVNAKSPLAKLRKVYYRDLLPYIEIAHADPVISYLPHSVLKREEWEKSFERRIYVIERASQLELLAENPATFMWVSPMPQETLVRYGLVTLPCEDTQRIYRDSLIHLRNYKLTPLDEQFIEEVCSSRRRCQKW